MLFETYRGGSEGDEAAKRRMALDDLLFAGRLQYVVTLNGGSQTRREAREYWQQFESNAIEVISCSWQVIIRLRRPDRTTSATGHSETERT